MQPERAHRLRHQLIHDGYCHIPSVAPRVLIDGIREISDALAENLPEEEKWRRRLQGSLIEVGQIEELVPLIILPAAIGVLADLGFPKPKFFSGYIISKPPDVAPALFWHQDGITWGEQISYTEIPTQFFLMYYLIDTNPQNGCLRVIPGSHLHRHRLHGLPPAHTDEIQEADETHPALRPDPDESNVAVKAGDLIIGDARILHSAHPNHSDQRRTVITLWFCPTYDELPESLQAIYGRKREKPDIWSDASWNQLKPLLAAYDGVAQPAASNRIPDERMA